MVGLGRGLQYGDFRGGGEILRTGGRPRAPVAVGVKLIGIDIETRKVSGAEACGEGDIGGVAARGHQNSSPPSIVMASVEVDPSAVEEDLVPRAEVAWAAVGLANVPDVAGDIAGRNILATREGDGQMLQVAADANALGEDIHGGLGGTRCVVVEGHSLMNPISNVDRL